MVSEHVSLPKGVPMDRLYRMLARRFVPPTRRLSALGMRIGHNAYIDRAATIDESHCWLITIGDDVTIAPRAYILAHDASTYRALGATRIANVMVGDRVFIGAGSIILPGVTIGDDCVVAAGAVVTGSVGPGSVVAGNPAREIARTDDILEKHRRQMAGSPFFDAAQWTVGGGISEEMKIEMRERIGDGVGYLGVQDGGPSASSR